MINAAPIKARPLSAGLLSAQQRKAYRLAICGDSTAAYEHGTRWSSTEFSGRSDAPNHVADDVGVLTIYSDGTATWQAAGDTAGPVTDVGDGIVWLESGSAGKGFGFNIIASDVAGSSPTGTANNVTVVAGSGTGHHGFYTGGAVAWAQTLQGWTLDITGALGIPGIKTADLLARIDNVLNVDSHGRPVAAKPDLVYVSCGINDCSYLTTSPLDLTIEDVLDNLTAIKDAVIARGSCVIFSSLSHQTPGARRPFMDAINEHFADMEAAHPKCVRFADYTGVVDNPLDPDRAANPGYMSGAHYIAGFGSYHCGVVLQGILNDAAGSRPGRSRYRSAYAPNLASGSWTVEEGTGIVPFGDVSVAVSTESVAGENDWTVLTVTGGTEDSYVIATKTLTALHSLLQGECELHINDLSKVGGGLLQGPRLVFMFYDASDNLLEWDAGYTMAGLDLADDVSGLMKTDVITPPAGAVSAKLMVGFYVPAGFDSVVKLRNAGARAMPGASLIEAPPET